MYAKYDLHLEQLDVKTAFIHGNFEEEIYLLQPEGFKQKGKENLVSRLNKHLYDLKKASRCWYKRFDSFIMSLEHNRLHAYPCAYFKRFGNNDFIILLLYVDDMLVAGPNKDHINILKAQLAMKFEMKDLGLVNKILGMQIHRDRVSRKIWLSHNSYLKKILQLFNMKYCKPISTPFPTDLKLYSRMSPSSKEERMEIPNIAHAVEVVSRYMVKPGREHWEAVKSILRYIKGTSNFALFLGESDLIIKGYVVSDYAGDLDGRHSTFNLVDIKTDESKEVLWKLDKAMDELSWSMSNKVEYGGWMTMFKDSGSEIEHEAGVKLALAPPVLASIYRDLRLLKYSLENNSPDDETKVIFWDPFQLVQIWIRERFRNLRPNYSNVDSGFEDLQDGKK
ncbi:retrovirus-related pol polyprotein from transposon TNT 1-94 [Tanacetum coccineum]